MYVTRFNSKLMKAETLSYTRLHTKHLISQMPPIVLRLQILIFYSLLSGKCKMFSILRWIRYANWVGNFTYCQQFHNYMTGLAGLSSGILLCILLIDSVTTILWVRAFFYTCVCITVGRVV